MPTHYSCVRIAEAVTPCSFPGPAAACSSSTEPPLYPLASIPSLPSCSNCCLCSPTPCCATTLSSDNIVSFTTEKRLRLSPATSSDSADARKPKERFDAVSDDLAAPSKHHCHYLDVESTTRLLCPVESVSSSSCIDKQPGSFSYGDWQRDAEGASVEVGGVPDCCAGVPTSGEYLDEVLDLLLKGVDAVPPEPTFDAVPNTHRTSTSSAIGAMASLEVADALAGQFPGMHATCELGDSDSGLLARSEVMKLEASGKNLSIETWQQQMDVVYPMRSLWDECLGRRSSDPEADEHQNQGITSISPGTISSTAPGSRVNRWAGPTLMDVESALAIKCSEPMVNNLQTSLISSSLNGEQLGMIEPNSFKSMLHQETACFLTATTLSQGKDLELGRHVAEDDDRFSTWKSLQKGSLTQPRYSVKIRCEEDAVNDGYRWRKYGQKSIKNSPYPRSYYRCSSGKCGAKKQVERSLQDAGVLVVSYEGIHLHHRPRSAAHHHRPPPPLPLPLPLPLRAPPHCPPLLPTCQGAGPPPLCLSTMAFAPNHHRHVDITTSPTITASASPLLLSSAAHLLHSDAASCLI